MNRAQHAQLLTPDLGVEANILQAHNFLSIHSQCGEVHSGTEGTRTVRLLQV